HTHTHTHIHKHTHTNRESTPSFFSPFFSPSFLAPCLSTQLAAYGGGQCDPTITHTHTHTHTHIHTHTHTHTHTHDVLENNRIIMFIMVHWYCACLHVLVCEIGRAHVLNSSHTCISY